MVGVDRRCTHHILARIVQVLHNGLARPDVVARLRQLGTGAASTQPAEMQQFLASEVARWLKIVRDEKIPYQD
jgi:tripartite-type tricarboxylate transporter receptor subunit TctC